MGCVHIYNYKDGAGFSRSVPANFLVAGREIAKSPKDSLSSGFPDGPAVLPIYKVLVLLPVREADLLL